jgi:soluble lytic murein transglycosylase-like protein
MNKERKTDIKIFIIAFLVLCIIGFFIYCRIVVKNSRVEFYKRYADETVAIAELHSADYYGLDWLWCMAITRAESKFKVEARSTYRKNGVKYHCYGLKQLAMSTAAYCREALGNRFKDTSIYAVDFNVWGGNLYIKSLMKNYCSDDIIKAIEIYNCGIGNYRRGKKEGVNRNSRHIKKVVIYYQQLKEEWNKYQKWYMRFYTFIFGEV